MTVPRLAVLLASGLLALAPAAPALAQSAGDEQYSDPLGGQTEGGGSGQSSPGLTETPQEMEGDADAAASAATPSPTPVPESSAPAAPAGTPTAEGTARTELPNTGADARVIALFGLALVLLGIGLRLRTADARP